MARVEQIQQSALAGKMCEGEAMGWENRVPAEIRGSGLKWGGKEGSSKTEGGDGMIEKGERREGQKVMK